MAVTRERLIETATRAVLAYEKWDVDHIIATRSPTSTHQTLPQRLGQPLLDPKGLRELMERFKPFFPNGVKFTPAKKPIVDVPNRNVVLYYTMAAESLVGEYKNEYIFIIDVNEEGTAVDHFEEFLDTEQMSGLLARVMALGS